MFPAAERLYPWLLDWVAESSQLPQDEALASLRKIAHQLLVRRAGRRWPHGASYCLPAGTSCAPAPAFWPLHRHR